MKKLTLDMDALEVRSFPTEELRSPRGTVVAADSLSTLPPYCVTFTCGDSHIRPCVAE